MFLISIIWKYVNILMYLSWIFLTVSVLMKNLKREKKGEKQTVYFGLRYHSTKLRKYRTSDSLFWFPFWLCVWIILLRYIKKRSRYSSCNHRKKYLSELCLPTRICLSIHTFIHTQILCNSALFPCPVNKLLLLKVLTMMISPKFLSIISYT